MSEAVLLLLKSPEGFGSAVTASSSIAASLGNGLIVAWFCRRKGTQHQFNGVFG